MNCFSFKSKSNFLIRITATFIFFFAGTMLADETIVIVGEREIGPKIKSVAISQIGREVIPDGLSIVVGVGGIGDPRSEEEKKQCRNRVDQLVTKCIDTYTFSGGATLSAYCIGVGRMFGTDAGTACVGFAGALTFKAREWCTAQGKNKKQKDC